MSRPTQPRPIESLLEFVRLTHEFQKVERVTSVAGMPRKENDLEHSAQLGLVAWFIADMLNLPYDRGEISRYALAHDLVEVYAGDTPTHGSESAALKRKRESEALKRLRSELPAAQSLLDAIEEYEAGASECAVFVRAVDKLLPPINIYLDQGRDWHEQGVTFDAMFTNKNKSTAANPSIHALFKDLAGILRQRPELFPKER